MAMFPFCIPGGHPGKEECKAHDKLPHGWRRTRARFDGPLWVYDETSAAEVNCCPEHACEGESFLALVCSDRTLGPFATPAATAAAVAGLGYTEHKLFRVRGDGTWEELK